MNIILAEVRADGTELPEQAFDQGVIRIGRDAGDCDIVFDSAAYPMVSRKHAELRFHDGRWMLVDLNSSYGTFLNDQAVAAPQQIATGSRIRIGQSGPVLRVVWFEVLSESVFNFQPQPSAPKAPVPAPPKAPVPTPAAAEVPSWETPAAPARVNPFEQQAAVPQQVAAGRNASAPKAESAARLEYSGGDTRPPVTLGQAKVSIGRDPSCEVVFEASSATVSRRHAEIGAENGGHTITDNNSFNGTLVNGQRISAPTPLYNGDEIQLGIGGPVLKYVSASRIAPKGASLAGQRSVVGAALPAEADAASKTMIFKADDARGPRSHADTAQPQLLMTVGFGGRKELTVGRGASNDIRLDGLQISNRHARLVNTGSEVLIEDLNSTNGVFVNGTRVSRQALRGDDAVQIGAFLLQADAAGNVGVFDTRSKTRVDAIALTKDVKSRSGGGNLRLVDNISLSVAPNEFVGLLGPSGAGKSTLMDALNGMRPADSGNVLINNLDLYRHIDSLKHAIGYVPQDDVLHRELTVYKTLYYTAKLRLSRDVSRAEINRTIDEVLDVTGLAERRDVRIDKLSGGQRKRVSIAVELITKPSVIFLDEPTSGLDPATEQKVMQLFRQIAESGRTVVMTTHAMENVKLFDKIVVMMRGKLAFYGKPDEALKYFGVESFKDLYDRVEEPAKERVSGDSGRTPMPDAAAEEWKQKYLRTKEYKEYVHDPLKQLGTLQQGGAGKKRRLGIFGAVRQWMTLSRRYLEVLLKDKLNLFILFAQAPVIAFLTFLVTGNDQPRDFVYFVLALVSIWFGTSVAAREIIRERAVYRRERMVNLGILPYVGSKLFVLGLIVGVQCLLLFVPLKMLDLAGAMPMPGQLLGVPQFWVMLLTAAVGVGLGLLVSALVKTSEMATSLVPLILIPQILFSGLVGVPAGLSKAAGLTMPAAWSFDTIKRYSTLDTLEPEGADPKGKTGGLGLYKFVETENEKVVADARKSIEDYQKSAQEKFIKYDTDVRNGLNPPAPRPEEPAAIPAPKKIPDDLSGYVTFLHPWMNEILNQLVLMLMFGILVISTLIVLRIKDAG